MTDRHVYLRDITQDERTSLSVLAGLVSPGARVLDLGTGSGALGKYLRQHAHCTVDGVTINEQEAALARPHYRRVEVADLDHPQWIAAFAGEHYDFIICADVLEHLKQPETALQACRQLLAPGGRVLISIPNAAYCGLVAELMQGDFAYRQEGLLDRTHLRFFTRRSLKRFLGEHGWEVESLQTIDRALPESEFKVPFDQLPPAVARYLLAIPDAAAYQLIASARMADAGVAAPTVDSPAGIAHALFTAQLYVGGAAGYDENAKLSASGIMGQARQVVRFEIADPAGLTALRLDPADRPGFLHLYRISLLAYSDAGLSTPWQWRCETDGLQALASAQHDDMTLRSPWPAAVALVLLHGNDPRIELPIPPEAFEVCRQASRAVLEIEVGWPMSGDYMALVEAVAPLKEQIALDREAAGAAQAAAQARIQEAQTQTHEAQMRIEQLTLRQEQLVTQTNNLSQVNHLLASEKQALSRHRLELQADLASLNTRFDALATHLRWIENSTVFRMTRPLVKAKMALQGLLRPAPQQTLPASSAPVAQPVQPTVDTVDVIVPVYRGLDDTQCCVRSVLASQCRTPWRLILLNDASPEPEVTQWLREVSQQDPRILLLENPQNLGFVGTVNRGMALSDAHDVVLLNSDAEVANDWLDRLRRAAYSDARVASVTPFSNNATICSYPRFCEANELPPGYDTASLDALFASTSAGQVVDVPTGVGFCMYIRRDSLRDVGLFDVEAFGKGYGEENDFCQRAQRSGWRNLHTLDTFVRHAGGISFGASKSQRELDAMEILRRMHPNYERQVSQFVAEDPARVARRQVDVARMASARLPVVLAVLHDRAGGTVRHVQELAEHLQDRAVFLKLTPAAGGIVLLESARAAEEFKLWFHVENQLEELVHALRCLGVQHLHYHHLIGHHPAILALPSKLGLAYDFTAHDFYTFCPQISLTDHTNGYCGELGVDQCHGCLRRSPAPGGASIESWREQHGDFISNARHVLAPSRDAASRLARFVATADVRVAPHTDIAPGEVLPVPQPRPLAAAAPLKVVVLGALSTIKGADVLEDVAVLAARQKAPVEFHLLGYGYRHLLKQPRAALTVHGEYADADLPGLLAWLQPDLVWFPAQWPETYSYTLSACLKAGLPIVAPDLGAFAERLGGRRWSWVRPWNSTPAQWLEFFRELREKHFITGQAPAPQWTATVAASLPVVLKDWSYDSDYLRELASVDPEPLTPEFLAAHQVRPESGVQAAQSRLKRLMLSGIVRLRSAQGLRQLARAVPLRWQTRVKTWLRS